MQMSAKPREHLPSWQSENFCQNAQKEPLSLTHFKSAGRSAIQ